MTSTEWAELPLQKKLLILKECDGKHFELDEIFNCESCNKLFMGNGTEL